MPMKLNKTALKESIVIEEQMRDRLNNTINHIDAIAQQQNLMYMAKEVGSNVSFFGSHSGKLELWEDYETKIEAIYKQLVELKTKVKYSVWKEKLWRYAYNGDLPNVIKYHDKMETYERKHMEELNDIVSGDTDYKGIRVMEFHGDDEEEREADNTGGYMMICDEYKKRYEIGLSIIKHLVEKQPPVQPNPLID